MSKASFKIGGETYEFKDITLDDYYKIKDLIAEQEEGSEFKFVEILTGCPVDQLRRLKYVDWIMVWEEAQVQITMMSQGTESIVPTIEFKGVKYGLPNIEDMSIGEFADLDIIFSDSESDNRLADVAAILYRPVIKEYKDHITIAPYENEGFQIRKEIFKDLPLKAIKSANSFFLQSANSSLKNMTESLLENKEIMKLMKEEDQEILKSLHRQGFGGDYSIPWLEKMFLDFSKHPSYKSELLLTGLRGKSIKSTKKSFKQRVLDYARNKKQKNVNN